MTSTLRLDPKPAADVVYPGGAIVVCAHCGLPLYRLQQNVYLGEPAGRSAWKYAPVTMADLRVLMRTSGFTITWELVDCVVLVRYCKYCSRPQTLEHPLWYDNGRY